MVELIRAKLLPTITYGSEAQRGRDSKILVGVVAKVYRIIFGLPTRVSPAQIRLELGVQKQTLARQGATVIFWDKVRKSKPGTLNWYLWSEL